MGGVGHRASLDDELWKEAQISLHTRNLCPLILSEVTAGNCLRRTKFDMMNDLVPVS